MNNWSNYNIEFKGLKDGNHRFEYQIDASFFELVEGSLYDNAQIKLTVDLKKSPQMLILDYAFSGTLETVCDNCLEKMDEPIDFKYQTFVKFGHDFEEVEDENIVIIPYDETEYNLVSIVYDLIVTSQPIKHIHHPNELGEPNCDPDMVERLSSYLVNESNFQPKEGSEDDEDGEIDPRWDELKKLLDKNNN